MKRCKQKYHVVKNDSGIDYDDDFMSIEEHRSSDDVTDELSVAEQVFDCLQLYSEGFKPSFLRTRIYSTFR